MADPQVQLFSMRLWSEELGDGQREWRGQVRHVPSGETRYFREWAVLVEFMKEVLPRLDDGRDSKLNTKTGRQPFGD